MMQLPNRILYAVAYRYQTKNGNWKAQFDYLHASNQAAAKYTFIASIPKKQITKIVAIAPVIGYYVFDNHGDILSV